MKIQANCASSAARHTSFHGVRFLPMKGALKSSRYVFFLFLAQCSEGGDPPPFVDAGRDVLQPTYTIEQLKDPDTCKTCHEKHYREWSGSMHAYASDDPLFLAMNERGQRQAN